MRELWGRLSQTGLREDANHWDARTVVLTNRITLLAMFFVSTSMFINLLLGQVKFIPILSTALVLFLLVFFFNTRKLYDLAKGCLFVNTLGLLTYMQLNGSYGSGMEFYYLAIMVFPLLVWRRFGIIFAFELLSFLCVVGQEIYLSNHAPAYNTNALPFKVFYIVNSLYSSILVILGVIFYRNLNRRSEEELSEQNRIIRQKNAELEKINTDLERINADLEQFAYVASHDLKEPLRMISTFSQLLVSRYHAEDKEAKEFSGFITEGVSRMQQLLNDLLDYTHLTTPKPGAFQEVELQLVVESVLQNLRGLIEESDAQIRCEYLPVVTGIPVQLFQLFMNLVGNAIKFRSPGAVPVIHIRTLEEDESLIVAIEDNGIGIDAVYHERIFNLFQKLHPRDKYAGTGIGLSVCKKIVELHGGKIWINSTLGEGTTIYFSLQKAQVFQPRAEALMVA